MSTLFIDDTLVDPYVETPSRLEWLGSGGIVVGRTNDQSGQPHAEVLHLAAGLEGAVLNKDLFAVVSGNTTYSVTGDMAVGDWRFSVDPGAAGVAAPIVVLKFTTGALADLVTQPNRFFRPDVLIEDQAQTTARLKTLITSVKSRAASTDPEGPLYASLESNAYLRALFEDSALSTFAMGN